MNASGHDADISYQLQLRRKELIHLCVRWQAVIRDMPVEGIQGASWGPSDGDLQDIETDHANDMGDLEEDKIEDKDSADEDNETDGGPSDTVDDEDADLLAEFELVALTDQYCVFNE